MYTLRFRIWNESDKKNVDGLANYGRLVHLTFADYSTAMAAFHLLHTADVGDRAVYDGEGNSVV